jgi:glycosyltransferase 2 family protein
MNRPSPSKGVQSSAIRPMLSWLFRALVSAGLIVWIVWKFHFGRVLENMWNADRALLAMGVAVFIISGVLGAVQWRTLLAFHGVALEFAGTVARYFMGLFFNFILPGFVGGDVVRVYKTAVASGKTTQSFSSTLADRVLGLFVLVLFSLAAFVFLPSGPADRALPAAAVMFAALAGFIALFAFRRLGNGIGAVFGRFTPGGMGEKIAAVYGEMHLLTRSPSTLAKVFALSFLIQVTRITVHYLCARAVGMDLSFTYFALFVPVMEIVASLPFSFGGVGVREMMGVGLFSLVGVPRETVVSYTLLAYATGFTGSLPGAAAFAMSVGKRNKT